MNHRDLSLHEVAANLAPFRPHVDTTSAVRDTDSQRTRPESRKEERDSVAPGGIDFNRARVLDALHTYLWQVAGMDHAKAMPAFNRIVNALDAHATHLARRGRAE